MGHAEPLPDALNPKKSCTRAVLDAWPASSSRPSLGSAIEADEIEDPGSRHPADSSESSRVEAKAGCRAASQQPWALDGQVARPFQVLFRPRGPQDN
ncbi:hypothetical protein XA68_17770 [Ophiocordyceps unilateralis]|uniref:Uncharacterized protein n=1 Tax=Ophiocordyceps unilateralis TaxID=268505 RepID=A0A2A9PSU8_OPHUN|nr:hypothetical protein XA68_17770 [Ophiocordyceps unilateralis]